MPNHGPRTADTADRFFEQVTGLRPSGYQRRLAERADWPDLLDSPHRPRQDRRRSRLLALEAPSRRPADRPRACLLPADADAGGTDLRVRGEVRGFRRCRLGPASPGASTCMFASPVPAARGGRAVNVGRERSALRSPMLRGLVMNTVAHELLFALAMWRDPVESKP
jgi:hypothetical protein